MKISALIDRVGNFPVIETELLSSGISDSRAIKVQISRWVRSGKLIRLRRSVYLLNQTYRKVEPYDIFIASVLKKPSYVSLEKALEFHGLIPEGVPVHTCITTKRPERLSTPLGIFDYRHVLPTLFWGYEPVTFAGQTGYMAVLEKALLDYFYLKGGDVSQERLDGLRLQNLGTVDERKLLAFADRFAAPGMIRVAQALASHRKSQLKLEKHL